MAQVSSSRKNESGISNSSSQIIYDAPKNDLHDLVSLICDYKNEERFSLNSNLWLDCEENQDIATESVLNKINVNPDDSVSLAAYAKKHFLSNGVKIEKENNMSNINSVLSLASYFQSTCSEQKDEAEFRKRKNLQDIDKVTKKSLADLFYELETAEDEFQATRVKQEDETDFGNISQNSLDSEYCTKQTLSDFFLKPETPEESNNFEVNLSICLKSKAQHTEKSNTSTAADLMSTKIRRKCTFPLTPEPIIFLTKLQKKTISKPLSSTTSVKKSLLAQTLSSKMKTNSILKQKVSDIEIELSKRYLQLCKISTQHKKQNNNLIFVDQSALGEMISRYTYGLLE